MLLVDVERERFRRPRRAVADVSPVRLHQLAQRLAPRLLVRRVDQHPVDVENRSPELRHTPSSQSWAGGPVVAWSWLSSNTVRSIALTTSTRPDQFSGTSVYSIPAWWCPAMLTNRRLCSALFLPLRSRKCRQRTTVAHRMS